MTALCRNHTMLRIKKVNKLLESEKASVLNIAKVPYLACSFSEKCFVFLLIVSRVVETVQR